jgi:hypothetical protein
MTGFEDLDLTPAGFFHDCTTCGWSIPRRGWRCDECGSCRPRHRRSHGARRWRRRSSRSAAGAGPGSRQVMEWVHAAAPAWDHR